MQKVKSAGRDETRTRLLAAAVNVFAEHGYAAATTRDICSRAGANAAAVNYHFGDKRGLYTAVLKSLIAAERALEKARAMSDSTPEVALRGYIEGVFHDVGESDNTVQYTRIMVHELAKPTAGLELVVRDFIRPRADALRRIVAAIIDDPVDSLRSRLCAHSVIAQMLHYYHARPVIALLWPKWHLDEPMRVQMVEHFTRFSLAALHHLKDHGGASPKRLPMPRVRNH